MRMGSFPHKFSIVSSVTGSKWSPFHNEVFSIEWGRHSKEWGKMMHVLTQCWPWCKCPLNLTPGRCQTLASARHLTRCEGWWWVGTAGHGPQSHCQKLWQGPTQCPWGIRTGVPSLSRDFEFARQYLHNSFWRGWALLAHKKYCMFQVFVEKHTVAWLERNFCCLKLYTRAT